MPCLYRESDLWRVIGSSVWHIASSSGVQRLQRLPLRTKKTLSQGTCADDCRHPSHPRRFSSVVVRGTCQSRATDTRSKTEGSPITCFRQLSEYRYWERSVRLGHYLRIHPSVAGATAPLSRGAVGAVRPTVRLPLREGRLRGMFSPPSTEPLQSLTSSFALTDINTSINLIQHLLQIFKDTSGREPDHGDPKSLQRTLPLHVSVANLLIVMCDAIHLNSQTQLTRIEIHDVTPNDKLPVEGIATLFPSQMCPQPSLALRHVFPQCPSQRTQIPVVGEASHQFIQLLSFYSTFYRRISAVIAT